MIAPRPVSGGQACGRCRRPAGPEELLPVPWVLRFGLALSLGAFHVGMWIWQELSQPFCRPCRRRLSVVAALLLLIVGSAELFALKWLLFDWVPSFRKG